MNMRSILRINIRMEKLSTEDRNDFLEHIKFMQHERLIHLLVTILFAFLLMFGFIIMLIYFLDNGWFYCNNIYCRDILYIPLLQTREWGTEDV